MASIVARIRGWSAGMKPTMGIIRFEASSSSDPNDWVNAPTSSFQPRVMIASAISSRVDLPSVDAVERVEAVGQRDRAIERHPAHQLGVQEVAGLAPDLPDAVVGLLPAGGGGVGEVGEEATGDRPEPVELVGEPVGGVEQLAVHVELALVPRTVADAHRRAGAPAGQVRELALAEVVLTADAEHDLEVGALANL